MLKEGKEQSLIPLLLLWVMRKNFIKCAILVLNCVLTILNFYFKIVDTLAVCFSYMCPGTKGSFTFCF